MAGFGVEIASVYELVRWEIESWEPRLMEQAFEGFGVALVCAEGANVLGANICYGSLCDRRKSRCSQGL